MTKRSITISRRSMLVGMTGAVAAPMILRSSRAAANSGSVIFTSWGGSFQAYMKECVTEPFTKETGITVNIVPGPDNAKIKAMQLTGNVQIDVMENLGPIIASGAKQGFWEKLDPSMFDLADMVAAPTSDSVPWTMWAGGIAWDPKKFGPGKHPSNFVEYWDLEKFPGRRLLRGMPNETMEAALLADGVAPKDIYPLDVDRAFKALDRIKPSIASWVGPATQTVTLAQTGEVDFSYSYAHRVKATTEGGGAPLAFSFDQNLLITERLVVPKGAPNRENAMKLVAYFLRPEVQVRLMNKFGSIPMSKKAAPELSEAVRKWQPDLNNPKNLVHDDSYWADRLEAISLRFQQWVRT
ncbi:hypothetical protein WN73_12890 [Bradyrhizobium sp. CCBAU 45394]|uniref:ABC transporter substrate-binding protein n=1 Tax=Bradyrhizobium sp. CCBAU 45394 TaxID=1325087 RepID=UPI002303464C|nr:ABC transporter substrate-binding protein [Bradyrhizobium sp. CCBAU 45394]MDA9391526.1 hypothetical protein [Bradyrhizobium sp. CCBAU 45394]